MRVLFAGTPVEVLPVLDALLESSHQVLGVITKPPKKKHRGLQTHPSPVEKKAIKEELARWYPSTDHWEEVSSVMRSKRVDVLITAAYGVRIPEHILTLPRYGCLNLHPSLLPRWRGAAPIEHTIMAGDKDTAMCIIKMEKTLDTGAIFACSKIPVPRDATTGHLLKELFLLGAKMLLDVLKHLPIRSNPYPQVGAVTLAHAITKADAFLDPKQSAIVLERKIRAMMPSIKSWLHLEDGQKRMRLNVLKSHALPPMEPSSSMSEDISKEVSCGDVITHREKGNEGLTLVCRNGERLVLEHVQREGKNPMNIKDFIRGSVFSDKVRHVSHV